MSAQNFEQKFKVNLIGKSKLSHILQKPVLMGESFQDYSWIQDFEADFPQKVSLKMLN